MSETEMIIVEGELAEEAIQRSYQHAAMEKTLLKVIDHVNAQYTAFLEAKQREYDEWWRKVSKIYNLDIEKHGYTAAHDPLKNIIMIKRKEEQNNVD